MSSLTVRGWLGTSFASLLGLSAMIALVTMLIVKNGAPASTWTVKVTLNTIVSILVQVAQGFCGLANGAVIFQLGVIPLLQRNRRLDHFNLIFRASHGVNASLQLILTHQLLGSITLSASLTCLGPTMGPFAQNTVTLVQRTVAESTAYLPRAQIYNVTWPNSQPRIPDPGIAMKQAMQLAWTGPSSDIDLRNFGLQPDCQTGNCDFPQFKTFGVVGKCFDLSPNISSSCSIFNDGRNCSYSLRGSALSLPNSKSEFNMTSNVDFSETSDFSEPRQQFTNFDALAWTPRGVRASRCITYAAILSLEANVSAGRLSERPAAAPDINTTAHFGFDDIGTDQWFSLSPNNDTSAEPFYSTNNSVIAIQNFAQSVFSGSDAGPTAIFPTLVFLAMQDGTEWQRNDDMAAAMSTQFRIHDSRNSTVQGRSLQTISYFYIRWPYLAVPMFAPLATMFLLVYTITISRLKKQDRHRADAITLLDMAPSDASREWIKHNFRSNELRLRDIESQVYFDLADQANPNRLNLVHANGPSRRFGFNQMSSKTTEKTEGGITQFSQAFQNATNGNDA